MPLKDDLARAADPAHRRRITQTLELARKGDIGRFAEAIDSFYVKLYLYCQMVCGKKADADQCLRAGIAAAHRAIATLGEGNFEAFVFKAVRRQVMQTLRARRWTPANQKDESTAGELRAAVAAKSDGIVYNIVFPLLHGLHQEERESFVIAAVLDYAPTMAELILETEASTIQSRLFRSCDRLEVLTALKDAASSAPHLPPPAEGSTERAQASPSHEVRDWDVPNFWRDVGRMMRLAAEKPPVPAVDLLAKAVENRRVIPRVSRAVYWRRTIGRACLYAILPVITFFAGLRINGHGRAEASFFVRFTHRQPDARSVLLVGDFTGWQKRPLHMHLNTQTGIWETWAKIKPGRYHYLFLVNDRQPELDDGASEAATDGEHPFSVLFVPAQGPSSQLSGRPARQEN